MPGVFFSRGQFFPDTYFNTYPSPPKFSQTWKAHQAIASQFNILRVPHRPENSHWQISMLQFYIIGASREILPIPIRFYPIIWPFFSLYMLYTDCITLTHRLRICQHNFSPCHTIIRECQDAILRFIGILLISLILKTPSMLPPNWSNRFQCTIFTLPSPATGTILKTGNPMYCCPSTQYTVYFQWSWILHLPLKSSSWEEPYHPLLIGCNLFCDHSFAYVSGIPFPWHVGLFFKPISVFHRIAAQI